MITKEEAIDEVVEERRRLLTVNEAAAALGLAAPTIRL
jgi:hypothetical protein